MVWVFIRLLQILTVEVDVLTDRRHVNTTTSREGTRTLVSRTESSRTDHRPDSGHDYYVATFPGIGFPMLLVPCVQISFLKF